MHTPQWFIRRFAVVVSMAALSSAVSGQTAAEVTPRKQPDAAEAKRVVSPQETDRAIAEEIATRFQGDRSKYLDYLRARGKTPREYRNEVAANLAQQPRPQQPVATEIPVQQVHLRLIQLNRKTDETDGSLLQRGNAIMAKLKAGETFADLAIKHSEDMRNAKGGDWGWVKRDDLKKPFSDTAFQLGIGQAAAPIILPEGCFILFVENRR
jgi:peptidyl-prolyl cis-trans isomerase SurA